MGNSLFVIEARKGVGIWVFDDPQRGIINEALVSGVPAIIEHYVGEEATKAQIIFADHEWPGAMTCLKREPLPEGWVRQNGTWYVAENGMRGWLCSCLNEHYFPISPEEFWFSVEAIG